MMQGSQLPPATIGEEVVELRVSRKRGSKLKTEKADMWSFNLPAAAQEQVSFLISHILLKELCTIPHATPASFQLHF